MSLIDMLKKIRNNKEKIANFYLYNTYSSKYSGEFSKYKKGEVSSKFKEILEKEIPGLTIEILEDEKKSLEKIKTLSEKSTTVFIWSKLKLSRESLDG